MGAGRRRGLPRSRSPRRLPASSCALCAALAEVPCANCRGITDLALCLRALGHEEGVLVQALVACLVELCIFLLTATRAQRGGHGALGGPRPQP